MAMVVVSDRTMCCMDCGGFHFLAVWVNFFKLPVSGGAIKPGDTIDIDYDTGGCWIVEHPSDEKFVVFDPRTRTHHPCPNSGKRFAFPNHGPTLAIEVK